VFDDYVKRCVSQPGRRTRSGQGMEWYVKAIRLVEIPAGGSRTIRFEDARSIEESPADRIQGHINRRGVELTVYCAEPIRAVCGSRGMRSGGNRASARATSVYFPTARERRTIRG
jgi:hypothetical protein